MVITACALSSGAGVALGEGDGLGLSEAVGLGEGVASEETNVRYLVLTYPSLPSAVRIRLHSPSSPKKVTSSPCVTMPLAAVSVLGPVRR